MAKQRRLGVLVEKGALASWVSDCLLALTRVGGVRVVELYPVGEVGAKALWLGRALQADLDVLLNLTPLPVDDALSAVARHGAWFFQHMDPQHVDHCLRPLLEGASVTQTTLQRQLRDGKREVLHEGCFATVPFSPVLNRKVVTSGSADWVARVFQEWNDTGVLPTTAPAPAAPAPLSNSWAAAASRCCRLGYAYAREHWRSLTRHGQWNVGIIAAPVHEVVAAGDGVLGDVIEWLPPPRRGRFYADPFAIHVDDRLHVFVEDLDLNGDARGRIAVFSEDESGELCGPVPVLCGPFHLSYPCVFESDGDIYCVPETFERNEVTLLRARSFPHDWECVATLVKGMAIVDPTICCVEGRWWLFATAKERGSETKLLAWWADRVTGPWNAHRWNPLKTDVRSARPAGSLFRHNGRLFRPAQDCSQGYGGAVQILEITELSPTSFRERLVRRLTPDPEGPYPHGLHTISGSGAVTVVDGVRNAVVLRSVRREMTTRLQRLSSRCASLPLKAGTRLATALIGTIAPGRPRTFAGPRKAH